jgi:hypothetical protein
MCQHMIEWCKTKVLYPILIEAKLDHRRCRFLNSKLITVLRSITQTNPIVKRKKKQNQRYKMSNFERPTSILLRMIKR